MSQTGKIESILVIGLGKVGTLVATLLNLTGYQVLGVDRNPPSRGYSFKTKKLAVENSRSFRAVLKKYDAVVTCLPYHLNLAVAKEAHSAGKHYFDLTEDVPTTQAIQKLARTAKGVMAPQCGLAPGYIGVVGADLAKRFDQIRSLELRVGALPQHPRGLLGYAFNWSPEGVVNEYLNDCQVLVDGKKAVAPPMGGLETIVIDGVQLEAFSTSGGLGTLCNTFEGKIGKLNYKTIRYPGHCKLMQFFFNELLMKNDRAKAGEILVNAKPPVNDDVVYIHAAAEGQQGGRLFREEYVTNLRPKEIAGKMWRAISWTTAASVCAVVNLVSEGKLPAKGFIRQEKVALEDFLATPTGSYFKA